MPTKYKLNFRSTVGAWGEVSPSGVVLGDIYPVSIAGLTCGWFFGTISRVDYVGATDARLSGRNSHNAGGNYFRVDLPLGPGTYRLWLAHSALSSTTNNAFIVRDGAGSAITTVASISVPGNAAPANADVLDASGAVIDYDLYISTDGGTYIEFTAVNDHIRIERNGVTQYLNSVMLEPQEADLEPAVLSTEFGTGTHSGTIYPKEPQGLRFGRITAPNGTQAFTVQAGGTYFAVEVDGAATWLVATSTRIPDAHIGSVTIRQTSGSQTEDTVFALTASTLDRPVTGILGRTSSKTLVERARVTAVMAAECWAGYTGQTLATDQTVTGRTDFVTKFNALSETGWHRLRLQAGDYTGIGTLSNKDWIATGGGVVIEPDTGHDPVVRMVLEGCHQRGAHWRGCILAPTASTSDSMFNCGITAPYPVYRIENNRIGHRYAPGYTLTEWNTWSTFMSFEFCEEVSAIGNTISAAHNVFKVEGGRRMRFLDNNFNLIVADFHALSTAFRFDTPRGVFADDLTYVQMSDSNAWHNPDIYTGLVTSNTPHGDWVQVRRTGGTAYPLTSVTGSTQGSGVWSAGFIGLNVTEDRLYQVASVTGTALYDPLNIPSGVGSGIVSGDVTWNYHSEYNIATEMVCLIENNCLMQDGETINADGNATPNIQFTINSNVGWKNVFNLICLNNICASMSSRGIDAGLSTESQVHAEWNSFVGGAHKALNNNQSQIGGGAVRARNNIVGLVSGQPNIVNLSAAASGNVAANFANGAVSPNRPGDVMRGSFTDFGGGLGWGYTMTDDETITAAEFRSAMSRQMHHITGAAGAKLREVHTITVGSEDYEIEISE